MQLVPTDEDVGQGKGKGPQDNDPNDKVVGPPEAVPDVKDALVEEAQAQLDGPERGLLDDNHDEVDPVRRDGPRLGVFRGDGGPSGAVDGVVELYASAGGHDEGPENHEPVVDSRGGTQVLPTGPEAEGREANGDGCEDGVHWDRYGGGVIGHDWLCHRRAVGCMLVSVSIGSVARCTVMNAT